MPFIYIHDGIFWLKTSMIYLSPENCSWFPTWCERRSLNQWKICNLSLITLFFIVQAKNSHLPRKQRSSWRLLSLWLSFRDYDVGELFSLLAIHSIGISCLFDSHWKFQPANSKFNSKRFQIFNQNFCS